MFFRIIAGSVDSVGLWDLKDLRKQPVTPLLRPAKTRGNRKSLETREVEKFIQAGKGVCLLSDDEPFTVESNELAKRLYGVTVKGNYIADKIAYVRDRNLTPADIRKFHGQYEVADHPLLTGVNFLYEGITISNVGKSDKLEVALKASDGQPLIALSKVPGQRVVISCAFTQFWHGPTERTSYVLKSAGAVRLAQNMAAYLAGK